MRLWPRQHLSFTWKRTLHDFRSRHEKEQQAKAKSIGGLIALGVVLGVIGTIIRIKVMAVNPPPRKEIMRARGGGPTSSTAAD